jgi:hypothetical protein
MLILLELLFIYIGLFVVSFAVLVWNLGELSTLHARMLMAWSIMQEHKHPLVLLCITPIVKLLSVWV